MATCRRRVRPIKRLHGNYTKQGKHMLDTIELLEAIGQDATLRHASAEELTTILEQAQASGALTAAVASGDSSRLSEELGHKPIHAPQIAQSPGHEGDEPGDDEGGEPRHPPAPDHGKSPTQR
jgi:hypothetical protein